MDVSPEMVKPWDYKRLQDLMIEDAKSHKCYQSARESLRVTFVRVFFSPSLRIQHNNGGDSIQVLSLHCMRFLLSLLAMLASCYVCKYILLQFSSSFTFYY